MKGFLVPEAVADHSLEAWLNRGKDEWECLRKLCALYRINTVTGIKVANHGWLGASFSAMELLAYLYHVHIPEPLKDLAGRNSLVLSKGHAVMAQYAVLAGLKVFPTARLLKYKSHDGLPAHCDRKVPGVDADSGALGMGLSKAIGISRMHRHHGRNFVCYAILGDGELQEGQIFESMLTLRTFHLTRCIPIIDRNYLQSDSTNADIKDAHDWKSVFEGLGFKVFSMDGHDFPAMNACFEEVLSLGVPAIVIAETRKGAGTAMTDMSQKVDRRKGIWHGKVPSDDEYLEILADLVGQAEDSALDAAFQEFRQSFPRVSPVAGREIVKVVDDRLPYEISTGEAFGNALVSMAEQFPDFMVLDADLEKACRLTGFACGFPDRFLEVGISEQDMVSIASGLALGKGVAIVNTYASFYKRCLDQVCAAVAEELPLIFAGHYADLDYFTDGKSHQALNDIAFMRSMGVTDIFEPLTAVEVEELLACLLERMTEEAASGAVSRPTYIRLHRTPTRRKMLLPREFAPGRPFVFPGEIPADSSPLRLFVSGPHFLELALEVQKNLADSAMLLEVIGVSSYFDTDRVLAQLVLSAGECFALEGHLPFGGLGDLLASISGRQPVKIGPSRVTGSVRTFSEMLDIHGLTVSRISETIKKVASQKGHQERHG